MQGQECVRVRGEPRGRQGNPTREVTRGQNSIPYRVLVRAVAFTQSQWKVCSTTETRSDCVLTESLWLPGPTVLSQAEAEALAVTAGPARRAAVKAGRRLRLGVRFESRANWAC